MKKVLKVLGLVLLVAVASRSQDAMASLDPCLCRIHCGSGAWAQIPNTTIENCCNQFGNLCGYWGNARCEYPNGLIVHCPSITPPGGGGSGSGSGGV